MWYFSDMARHYKLFFDGSCGPKNPGGTAAFGFALVQPDPEFIYKGSGVIGTGPAMSNNLAEFHALWKGLEAFWRILPAKGDSLSVYGDSNLVIQIMNRHWRARADKLYYDNYVLANRWVRDLRNAGFIITFDWVPREQNKLCDDLSKAHQQKV